MNLYTDMAEAEAIAADLVADRVGSYEVEQVQDDATGEFLGWAVVQVDRNGKYLSRWPDVAEPDYS